MIKYHGKNINVASHNRERREEYKGAFTFSDTWGMGCEGFSKGPHLLDMNPLTGCRNEYWWLLGILIALPLLKRGRRDNEDGIASALGTANNRYSQMHLSGSASRVSTQFSV